MSRANNAALFLRLTPLMLPFAVIVCGGLAFALLQSFGFLLPVPVSRQGGIFRFYVQLFAGQGLGESFFFSVWVATISGTLSLAAGTILAILIWRMPHSLRPYSIVYKLPLVLPHLVAAFLVILLLSSSGVLSSVSHRLGLIQQTNQFPELLYSSMGTGMIAAYMFKEIPFVILMVYSLLRNFDTRLLDTAKMLGAGEFEAARTVLFPYLLPVLNTSFIIIFLYSFGAFDIPYLLSPGSPQMLSITAYNLYFNRSLEYRPQAMAVLVIMFLFSSFFILIYSQVASKLSMQDRQI